MLLLQCYMSISQDEYNWCLNKLLLTRQYDLFYLSITFKSESNLPNENLI